MVEFVGTGTRLVNEDIELLANRWGVEERIIHAVDVVESNGRGFLSDNRPKILYEAHVFWRLTQGHYGKNNISYPVWNKSLYGKSGAHQYDRLHQALMLNRPMALQSASWGRYQILGVNYKSLGYESPEIFITEMKKGEKEHLKAFSRFCEINNLVQYLRNKNWPEFVRRYNGGGQVGYYVVRFVKAYDKWKEKEIDIITIGFTGKRVKELQLKLGIVADGVFGKETDRKVKEFQTKNNLLPDGVVGSRTWKVLDSYSLGKE